MALFEGLMDSLWDGSGAEKEESDPLTEDRQSGFMAKPETLTEGQRGLIELFAKTRNNRTLIRLLRDDRHDKRNDDVTGLAEAASGYKVRSLPRQTGMSLMELIATHHVPEYLRYILQSAPIVIEDREKSLADYLTFKVADAFINQWEPRTFLRDIEQDPSLRVRRDPLNPRRVI